jgi:two-component system sensor kinase FixL
MRRIIDRAVAIFDEAGRPVRLLGANVDVTDAREAEERLRELQSQLLQASRLSAMGEMAATLAHELNQPLGAAANFLNAARLAIQSHDPEAAARALARIEKAAEQTMRAGAILRRLREFIGRGEIDKQIASAQRLVEEAVSLALIGVHDPSLKIRYAFHEPDTKVLVDAIQVQQVVFNLVRNALDATEGRHPREIELSTRVAGEDKVEIAVADTGPGLPADPETLFRPFSTTKAHGLGLGLSICRAIVEAHGGRLWGETGPHGGALFRFTVAAAPTGGIADE